MSMSFVMSFDKLRTNGRSDGWFGRLTKNEVFTPIPAFPHQGGRSINVVFAPIVVFSCRGGRGGMPGMSFAKLRTNGRG